MTGRTALLEGLHAYLAAVAATEGEALPYYAISVVGPRNRVDRIVGRLALL